MNYTTWWFEVTDEDSDLCGEQFLVEVGPSEDPLSIAWVITATNFGCIEMKCLGRVSAFEAEIMGLDTY